MLTRLAKLGIRAPKRVLGLAALILVVAAVFGAPVASHLLSGGFSDPSTPSSRADALLASRFDAGTTNLVLTVTSPAGADSASATRVGRDIASTLTRAPHVNEVASYWTVPTAERGALRSKDGRIGLVVARVAGDDSDAPKRAAAVADPLAGTRDGVQVAVGGEAIVYDQVNHHVSGDLARSEAVAIPLTTVALILVFGSLVAALLPLAVGIAAIIGTLAVLRLLTTVTDVSIFALNLTTALGLALAIDYSLFVVNRYREDVRAGASTDAAIRTTMRTAGRTVVFSALTVGLSLAGMLVFPLYFLRSFAYAGLGVVALATTASLVLLPAVLALVGPRIDSLDVRHGVRRLLGRPDPAPKPVQASFWYRFAHAVMRRAVPVGTIVVVGLLLLGAPFLGAHFGFPDERVLPTSASSHEVGDTLRSQFTSNASGDVTVVVPRAPSAAALGDYAQRLSGVQAVDSVTATPGTYAGGRAVAPGDPAMTRDGSAYLTVRTNADPGNSAGTDLLSRLRAVTPPAPVEFTGLAAVNQDSLDAIGAALPWALVIIVVATFVVLFLFTGSLLLPLKALALNTLSLSATFGAMVWIFQEGHLHWLFPDLTVTGHIDATMPPLMFCIAFGLSMDYEVFLLSRIREAWLASDGTPAANVEAVAVGLGRTGRIVTAAAALMAIVFASIATSSVSFMMTMGAGLTLAVLMDATVVRGMLVPAFMRLAGRWNWWAPAPLDRLHARIGLHEDAPVPVERKELAAV